MKKSLSFAITFCILFLANLTLTAQDIIHRKNGKTLEVNIIEIGDAEVKYKLFTQPDGVTFVMDATLVKKVVLANGTVHKFDEVSSFENKDYYEGQKKNVYKVGLLDMVFGYTRLGYEHSLKPGASIEAKLGIIGLGRNTQDLFSSAKNNQRGAFVGFGYKFINKPDSYNSRQRFTHLLHGGYIRPEISIGSYGEDVTNYNGLFSSKPRVTTREQTTYGCLMVCFGKQYILDKKVAIDLYTGIGIGAASRTKNNTTANSDGYSSDFSRYGNVVGPNNLAFNFGLNIGFLGK